MHDRLPRTKSFVCNRRPADMVLKPQGKGPFDRLIYNQWVQVDGSSLDLLRSNSIVGSGQVIREALQVVCSRVRESTAPCLPRGQL